MELDSLKLLQYLKDKGGLHNKISIAPFVDKLFPTPLSFDESQHQLKPLYRLIDTLQSGNLVNNVDFPSPNGSSYTWDIKKNIQMELTTAGDNHLNERLNKEAELEVNQLTIDSFELTQMVHKSVIDTNRKIVEISDRQAVSNETIANNSITQTDILKGQKWILLATVFVAACSVVIAYLSYRNDVPNNRLEQELKMTDLRLDTIQRELLQIRKNSLEPKEAKKILPKKK